MSSLCKKASQRSHALTRIVTYMNLSERKALIKTFVTFQLNYCQLFWMFHSRKLNHRINSIHRESAQVFST